MLEGKNSAYTKQYNRRRMLGLLRQRPTSRAELSRAMGLTRAAISLIADELIAEGIIRESSAQPEFSGPGRTPTMLKICDGAYYAVGVSLRRSGCKVGLEDLTGTLLASQDVDLPVQADAEQRVTRIAKGVQALLEETGLPRSRLLGVGVAAPGPVDREEGLLLNPPDFPGWENCPVVSMLEEKLGVPVFLENDACAAAMYNYMEHDFPERENFALLFVDCGVGSGIISDGKVLRSQGGFTPELGHTSIDFRGPKCSCGNRGCLERYASIDRITEEFGYDSWSSLMASPDREKALDREADYLAAGIVNLCNVVQLEAVLLGGRLHSFSTELLPRLEARVRGRVLSRGTLRFLPALKGADAYVRSACSVAFCRFLEI